MSIPAPELPSSCWPINTDCCSEFDQYETEVRARAMALAGETLRMLTGYSVGGCPVILRPCSPACAKPFTGFTPHINLDGQWVNACGCQTDCSCTAVSEIILPGFVGFIGDVTIDGVVLAPTAYRVDDYTRLVRQDGHQWPTCQDMGLPAGEVGTFTVELLPATPVDAWGAYVGGVLACEYAKACSGDRKCKLPSGVTEITRRGITMSIQQGMFPEGYTGIREVDAYIARQNPHRLKVPPTVWSPDLRPGRVTTFGG